MKKYRYIFFITVLQSLSLGVEAQTKHDVLRELQRHNVPHAHIVLAQARLESGNFKSAFYKRTNNLFGMKRGGKYASYPSWEDSVKDYKKRISRRYKGGSYYHFLSRIGYAADKKYIDKLKEIAK